MKTLTARWTVRAQTTPQDAALARRCEISPVTATVLRVRGHDTPASVLRFLSPNESALHDPFLMPDIEAAVARLHHAISAREPMMIHGDYDVDGITSTAMLMRALLSLGADATPHIPHRKDDGYGLSIATVEDAAARGFKLILTADCGVRDVEAAARARELGVDLIITDHHEPSPDGVLPDAVAVVNPKRTDSDYPFAELSGCGVAFKVMQALLLRHWPKHAPSFWDKFVELAGMAAIADCVPLVDENRFLAREGLRALASTRKAGLCALKKSAGLRDDLSTLRGSDVGFRLGPRLNAAGRLDSALLCLQLLTSNDAAECAGIAAQLEGFNAERRDIEKRITDEACAMVAGEVDLSRDMAIVISGEEWNGGVLGLVAGRLAERFCRPAIVLNARDGVASGSGRSAAGFDLHSAVEATRDLILRGGGHEAACGMALETARLDEFRARVLACAGAALSPDDLVPRVEVDCAVTGRDLTMQLARDLEKLEPCGNGNPEARLLLRGAKILDGKSIGARGEHVKWQIEADGARFDALWWRPGERAANLIAGTTIEMCFVPELNHWNGNTRLQLIVKDARALR